jgi:Major Facilitator Superfamily
MTDARTRQASPPPGGGGSAGGPLARSRYLEVLRTPGALSFSAAAAIGRMPMAMFGLGTVLLVAAVTGRYGTAGLVAAAGAVSYAGVAPQVARLAESFGQGRVLRPLAVIFAAATVTFIATAEMGAPVWALLVTSALAGATMPSLGSMVRTRWSRVLRDPATLHTAFSLESVADELIFVVGPAVVTLLATDVYPAAGVAAAMILAVAGTLWFAAQRRTEPPPRPARRQAARGRAAAGLLTLVPVYWCLGAMFATIDLSTVAFAAEHGHRQLAGVALGCYALGSAAGGLWYGSRTWRAPAERRFAVTLACVAAGVATFWFQPGLPTLFLAVCVAGLPISPTLIGGYSLIERQAGEGRHTEGMTWLSSAIAVGVATGSPLAGHIIDAHGARWGYLLAAGCGVAAAAACLAGLRRLRLRGGIPGGPTGRQASLRS